MPVDELKSISARERRKLASVLSYALFEPSLEKSTRTLDALISRVDTTVAFSKTKGEISGIIAYTACRGGLTEILYISVAPDDRLKGVGKELVDHIRKKGGCSTITAETDKTAVNFYRQLGFRIASLGEKYPGVERFACKLEIGS